MNSITNFIRTNQINSFQKLYFLLFLQKYPNKKGTSQEFAEQLYLDTFLLEKIITDLQRTGLLISTEQGWQLSDEPGIRTDLQRLVGAFECPLTRQELLEQIR